MGTTTLLNFTKHNMTLELHVPCRDPLEHLMSMANHLGIKYRCDDEVFETTGDDNSSNIEKSVHSAYMDRLGDKRFSNELLWNQKTSPEYQQKVHQLLMEKHPYMKFCHDCMGSTNE